MKTKLIPILAICLLSGLRALPATNDLATALQKGLFEEEANHNLDAAIQTYKSVVVQFDYDRKLVATAIFRLGECYRKQGDTSAANAQYERILREFPDQPALVAASRNYVQLPFEGRNGASPPSRDNIPRQGLVAQWHAEGNMLDEVRERNGIPHGDVTFAPGVFGRAFDFDGETGFIEVPSSPSLKLADEFTVGCWINYNRLTGSNGDAIAVKGRDYEGPLDWTMSVSSVKKLRVHVNTPTGWHYFDCETTLNPGVWYYVTMSYDGLSLRGYVNGVLDGEKPVSGLARTSNEPLRIGAYAPVNGTTSKCFFDGRIDELSLYDRALSADEIAAIHRKGREALPERKPGRPSKGPIALWHADENGSDSVGGNHAASMKEVEFAKGVFGRAFRFNGDGASVNIPRSRALADVEDQLTLEFWMKADPDNPMNTYQGLVTSDFYGIEIANGYVPGGSVGASFFISTTKGASWPETADANGGGAVLSPGKWHHLAGTYDGSRLQLYVDGQPSGKPFVVSGRPSFSRPRLSLAPSVAGTGGSRMGDKDAGGPTQAEDFFPQEAPIGAYESPFQGPSLDLPISRMTAEGFVSIGSEEGRRYEPSITHNRYFKGLIDEVAIYNRALRAEEISERYRAGRAALDGPSTQASSGPISFDGVKWTPWHTLFAVQGDKLLSLPKPRPGFNYGHTGDGRGAIIVANVGDSDWRDYSAEFEYCVTGIDPAFNPYGIGSDYHDGRIYFHLAEAHESWNQRGGSGYNLEIHGNGTWDLSCCYNNYCPAPVGYANPVKDGERQLAHGQGLKIDRELGNKFRIDVVGQRIRIWVDGEKIVDLVDDKMDELIGGQRLDHGGVGFEWGFEAMGWIRNFSRKDL